ncbi:MAG: efflux RND transporter periplasmic adaptor subunit [Patescibacteria group bacterium]|nr:efflux RND transporter periplasmic adaptor subunit [Patescibacteria group bacterium]
MLKKIIKFIIKRKIVSLIIALAVLGGGYGIYSLVFKKGEETVYILARAEKGTITASISGTGQISAFNQIDVKSKVSGDVIFVAVANGQEVKTGDLLLQIGSRDAQKAVRDAQTNLDSAKLALEKLKKPADTLSILQAENALAQAKESKRKAENDLQKAYDDGFNAVSNAFLDFPTIITGLEDILYKSTISVSQWNIDWYASQSSTWEQQKTDTYKIGVNQAYTLARQQYNKNFENYKAVSRTSDAQTLESLIMETYGTAKTIADAVKTSNNFIDFVKDVMTLHSITAPSTVAAHQSSLNTYTSKANSHLLNLLAIKQTIEDSKTAIANADRTIAEKIESLAKLKAGADELDIQAQELAVQQKENALLDAKENLNDYSIRAPFDGIAAKINFKQGDTISVNSAAATMVTTYHIAEISLNEIDAAKIKTGQKAVLTFDAIPDLSVNGEVSEIDTIGEISFGVVSYTVKIIFDSQEELIKPGMSMSASIITDTKQDVLIIPNSAVKSQGDSHYVEIFDGPLASSRDRQGFVSDKAPRKQKVEIGIASDEFTEIIFGLNEGERVVARTIFPVSAKPQTSLSIAGFISD